MAGLLFVYMGPEPAPLFPRYDVFAREDGTRLIEVQPVIDTNYLRPRWRTRSIQPTSTTCMAITLFMKGLRKTNSYRPI